MMVSGVSEVTTQRDGPEWSCSGLMNSIVQDRRDRENSLVQDRRDRENSLVEDRRDRENSLCRTGEIERIPYFGREVERIP